MATDNVIILTAPCDVTVVDVAVVVVVVGGGGVVVCVKVHVVATDRWILVLIQGIVDRSRIIDIINDNTPRLDETFSIITIYTIRISDMILLSSCAY